MTDPSPLLFTPGAILIALVGGLVWGWRTRWSAGPRRFLVAVAAFYAIAGLGIVPTYLGRLLASGYGRVDTLPQVDTPTAVVVLGGGTETAQGWASRMPLLTSPSAARAMEAARIFHLIDPQFVVSSGGESDRETGQTPSAILMSEALIKLGVPEARILVEAGSLNTRQQVERITPMLRERQVQRVVIVTSDLHMRRAEGAFRAGGWAPIPAAAPDVFGERRWRDDWAPGYGLGQSAQVTHEIIGISYYLVRGWWRWR